MKSIAMKSVASKHCVNIRLVVVVVQLSEAKRYGDATVAGAPIDRKGGIRKETRHSESMGLWMPKNKNEDSFFMPTSSKNG